MSGIIEAAGLTPEEAEAFVAEWGASPWFDYPANKAIAKLGAVVAAEWEFVRPPRVGDRVTFPFGKGEVFEVLCVYGDWVVGVGEDGIPTTLSAGAVERVTTEEHR